MDAERDEKWDVVITDLENASRKRLYTLPCTTLISEVRKQWCNDVGVTTDSGELFHTTGHFIHPDQRLVDVKEVKSGSQLVKLNFSHSHQLGINVYKSDQQVECYVNFAMSPSDICDNIKRKFPSMFDCDIRLRKFDGPLQLETSLLNQYDGVATNPVLSVELSISLTFLDESMKQRISFEVFVSEQCDEIVRNLIDLLDIQMNSTISFSCNNCLLTLVGDIGDVMRPFGAPQRREFTIKIHTNNEIVIMGPSGFSEESFPSSSSALKATEMCRNRNRSDYNQIMRIDESAILSSVDGSETLGHIQIPNSGVLFIEPIIIHLQSLSKGKLVLRIPGNTTITDLRRYVAVIEDREDFRLRAGEHYLHDDTRTLSRCNLLNEELIVEENTVLIDVGENIICRADHPIKFNDLAHAVCKETDMVYSTVQNMIFVCKGCGRKIWSEESDFQIIPVSCCRVSSQSLEIKDFGESDCLKEKSRKLNDLQYQLLESSRRFQIELRKFEDERNALKELKEKAENLNEQMRKEKAALNMRLTTLIQSYNRLDERNRVLKTQRLSMEFSLEQSKKVSADVKGITKEVHPSPQEQNTKSIKVEFYIINSTRFKNGADFNFEITFHSPPTVKAVKSTVLSYMGLSRDNVVVKRKSGYDQTEPVYWIFHEHNFIFSNISGITRSINDGICRELTHEDELFPVVANQKNVLCVLKHF